MIDDYTVVSEDTAEEILHLICVMAAVSVFCRFAIARHLKISGF
jgi:hypothetical protein